MTAFSGGRGRPEFQNQVPMIASRHESGGLIAVGQLADGTVWSAPLAHVAGRVLDSRTNGPVRGALVRLDSTDYVTSSDAGGQFHFQGVLAGPYVARVTDTLSIFRRRAHPDSGLVIDRTSVLQFVTRSATANIDTRVGHTDAFDVRLPWREPVGSCYGFNEKEPRFVLTAQVSTVDRTPLDSAHVTLKWTQPLRSSLMTTTIEAHTAGDGLLQVCGLPGNLPLEATVIWRGVEYRGTATVPLIDYDERGRRRHGNLRFQTIVVGRTGRGG
jgi:hypothetical protein